MATIGDVVERLVLAVSATVDGSLDRAIGKYGAISAAAVGTTAAVASWTIGQAAQIDEQVKAAEALQMTAEAYQEYGFAAERSGVSMEQMGTGLRALQLQLEGASRGTGEGLTWLQKTGIDATDAEGRVRSAADVFPEIADAYQDLATKGEKASLASRLLGESGGKLATLLKDGGEGVKALTDRARDLGYVFDEETGQAAVALTDAWTDLKAAGTGLSGMVAAKLIPELTPLVSWMTDLVIQSDGFVRVGLTKAADGMAWAFRLLGTDSGKALAGIAGVGAVIGTVRGAGTLLSSLSAASPLLGGVAKGLGLTVSAAAPFLVVGAAAVLILDDLATAARGGDSAILDLAEALGVGDEAARALSGTGDMLGAAWDFAGAAVYEAGLQISEGIGGIGESLEAYLPSLAAWTENLGTLGGFLDGVGETMERSTRGYRKAASYLAGDEGIARTGANNIGTIGGLAGLQLPYDRFLDGLDQGRARNQGLNVTNNIAVTPDNAAQKVAQAAHRATRQAVAAAER